MLSIVTLQRAITWQRDQAVANCLKIPAIIYLHFGSHIIMFGTRRVTYRLVVMIALVLLVFVYFFINSSHETVRDGLRDSSEKSSADAKSSYAKRTQVDVVVVEEHHEG